MKRRHVGLRATLAALAIVLLTPAIAIAHGKLERSAPASGATLQVAPTELRLTFTEAAELTFTRIELVGPDSQLIALDAPSYADGAHRVVVAAIRGPLVAGSYTVAWQMAGADGHPVSGRFPFTVAIGATGLAGPVAGGATGPEQDPSPDAHHDPTTFPSNDGFDAESAPYVAVRWITFTALLVVLGAVAFPLFVVAPWGRAQGPDSALPTAACVRAATLGVWAAVALGVAALLRLYAQAYALSGGADALTSGLVAPMLARTVWGWGWLAQMTGVVVAAAGFGMARRATAESGRRAAWAVATVGALALAFTPALSGHAAAVPRLTALAVLADGLHVIGAGGWLGGLLVTVAVGVPLALRLPEAQRGRAVADLVNAFSPTALVFAGLVAITGVFAAWLHLGTLAALWETGYGRTLLVKLAVLALVAGTGAYNWLRVRPALGDVAGARRIRRSATAELAIGLVVIAVTAVLVATPTGMEEEMGGAMAVQEADRGAADPGPSAAWR